MDGKKNSNHLKNYKKKLVIVYCVPLIIINFIFAFVDGEGNYNFKKIFYPKYKAEISKIIVKPYEQIEETIRGKKCIKVPRITEFKYVENGKIYKGRLEERIRFQNKINKHIKSEDDIIFDSKTTDDKRYITVIKNPEQNNKFEREIFSLIEFVIINMAFVLSGLIIFKSNLFNKHIKFYENCEDNFKKSNVITKKDKINNKGDSTLFVNYTPIINNEILTLKPKHKKEMVICFFIYILIFCGTFQNISSDITEIIKMVIGIIFISYVFMTNRNKKIFDKNLNAYYEGNRKMKLMDITSITNVEILYVYNNVLGSFISSVLNLNLLLNDNKRILIKSYRHKEIDKAKELAKVIGDFLNIDVVENNYKEERIYESQRYQ